jgi:hypothetical protein
MLEYVRPDNDYRQAIRVSPGTFLDRLARETKRVSERTVFQSETLAGLVLTGLHPLASAVRITETHEVCRVRGDDIPSRWVTLRFNTADVSYEDRRQLYAEIRQFFEAADAANLTWSEFDFLSLVDSMGGPPERDKTAFWKEVLARWSKEPASSDSPLNSWRAARNKYERLDFRKGVRKLATPNQPVRLSPVGRKRQVEAVGEYVKRRRSRRP